MKRVILIAAAAVLLAGPANADTKSNITSIGDSLTAIGMDWETVAADVCLRDNFCSILAGDIQIQAIAKTVDVMPSSQVADDVYLMACAATLAGLTGNPFEASGSDVVRGTIESAVGRSRQKFGSVTMTMERDSSGELSCSFVVA